MGKAAPSPGGLAGSRPFSYSMHIPSQGPGLTPGQHVTQPDPKMLHVADVLWPCFTSRKLLDGAASRSFPTFTSTKPSLISPSLSPLPDLPQRSPAKSGKAEMAEHFLTLWFLHELRLRVQSSERPKLWSPAPSPPSCDPPCTTPVSAHTQTCTFSVVCNTCQQVDRHTDPTHQCTQN